MFIRSVSSGGGYQGDVNAAYRKGRRLAFDDQIDAYSKALQTDINNYNFNQRKVQDTAANYGLQLGMNQAARNEAINFIDQSDKIAENAQAFDFNTRYRNYLQPHLDDMAQNKAQQGVTKYATDNYNQQVRFEQAKGDYGRVELDNENKDKNAKLTGLNADNNIATAAAKGQTFELDQQLANWHTPEAVEARRAEWKKDYIEKMQQLDPSKTPQQLEDMLKANPDFAEAKFKEYSNQREAEINRQRLALLQQGTGVNFDTDGSTVVFRQPGTKATTVKQQQQAKEEKPTQVKFGTEITDPTKIKNFMQSSTRQHLEGPYHLDTATGTLYVVHSDSKDKVLRITPVKPVAGKSAQELLTLLKGNQPQQAKSTVQFGINNTN